MSEVKGTKKKVTLGSGLTYMKEFTGTLPTVAELIAEMVNETYLAGYTKGGASIEYKPTNTTEKDDMGYKVKEVLTEEEATYKTGLFTWNGDTLKRLCATARVETISQTIGEATKRFRQVKIGGTANDDGKQYVVLFKHEDPVEGDCYLIIVGRNTAGFTITWEADSATVIDAEFACKPQDSEGTLVMFLEELDDTVTYTQSDLEAMTVEAIGTLATSLGYTITGSTKSEKITSFLAAQTEAQA